MPFDWGCCGDKNGRNATDAAAAPPRPVNLLSPSTSSHSVSKPSQVKRSPSQTTVPPQQASPVSEKHDLWKRAEEQLDENSRKRLRLSQDSNCPSIDRVLAEIIKEITAKYKDYQKGNLSIRNRDDSNKKIDVRGSAKKVLVCVLQAQDLIKAVVGFDPTGYASIAWSVVAFGLTLIKNDIDRRDAIMDASEFLAQALAYHSIIEHNYRKGTIPSSARLDDALVDVYVALLRYIAEVQSARHESAVARVGKSITALTDQPLDRLKSVVEQKGAVVDQWKTIVRDEDQNRLAEDQSRRAEAILVRIDEMGRRVHSIDVRTNDQEELNILDWISTFSYSNIQNETKKARSPDTGTWFVELSDRYQRWKTTPGQLLWLHGPVGCGKSVLCSTIIADTDLHCQRNEPCVLAYWYFKFSDNETQSMESMVRSFIRQLCPRPIPNPIRRIWEDHRRNREPDLDVLLTILREIMDLLPGDVFIIFDALDECPTETREKSLLAFMDGLIRDFPTKVHLLATSRPEPDIHNALTQHTLFGLEDALSGDVEKFVQERLISGKLRRWNRSILERIEHQLLNVSERQVTGRRFRWVDLQIKRLERCHIPQDIDEALTTIPDTLEATYKGILEQEILPRYHDAVRSIFTWLTFSMKPLSQETVAEVAGFPSPDSVIEICTTQMITLNTADGTIRLAHFSVKEFLLSEQVAHWCHMSEILGYRLILNQMLKQILSEDEDLSLMAAMSKPLLRYSSEFWPDHLRKLESLKPGPLQEIYSMLVELFTEPLLYHNWQRLYSFDFSYTKQAWRRWTEAAWVPPIEKAIILQLEHLADLLVQTGSDALKNTKDTGESTLVYAAEHSVTILALLLQRVITIPLQEVQEILFRIRPRSTQEQGTLCLVIDQLWNMGVLHDGRKYEDSTHPALLVSMVKNRHCGDVLLGLCLERGDKETPKVTTELLEATLQNDDCGARVLEVLIQRRDERISFTGQIMQTVAEQSRSNPSLACLILKNQDRIVCLKPEHAETFARTADSELLKLVLRVYGEQIMMERNVLLAAISNPSARDVVRGLLSGRELSANTQQSILSAAAAVERWEYLELINFLLDEWGPRFNIGYQTMVAAVSNRLLGLAILETLLARQQAGFIVSDGILVHAAKKNTEQVLQLLMINGGSTIPIRDELVFAAAGNEPRGLSVLLFLFPLLGSDYVVSSELLQTAAENPNKYKSPWETSKEFQAVLKYFTGTTVPDSVFLAMHDQVDHMKVLLDWSNNKAPTKEIFLAICDNGDLGAFYTLLLLLDRGLLAVDEWFVETSACTPGLLWHILGHVPRVPITDRVINSVRDERSLRYIVQHLEEKDIWTEEIMEAIISTASVETEALINILELYIGKAPLTESILLIAAERDTRLVEFLQQPRN
ncbi:hypothetical protein ASPACDRAFT_26596 [Aspergillus aculeatus ATCC 16872]|uniref:NACHT domain-containing protein n=1 Tax=Aspergillus aculeatus (strain ATCC 16872 / CBS 172.66 / WB 5094) TaxID=690307 RepID=A0A1L9WYZ9_ASPA1|nr:uncharacterized protein ASPACDRAFT_26596 [Aspergillus aculeatus ATCC 16872]OJK01296.1 hypothetical protein ASPACDRAFT_26596 [Aspergillus aculeatus ATCC 16872]